MHYIKLHYTYITFHYITLCYVTLRYITLLYVTLRYITLYYIANLMKQLLHEGVQIKSECKIMLLNCFKIKSDVVLVSAIPCTVVTVTSQYITDFCGNGMVTAVITFYFCLKLFNETNVYQGNLFFFLLYTMNVILILLS